MGVIKTDNVFTAPAAFALDANQFPGIDVIAVVGRVVSGVGAPGNRSDEAMIVVHLTQQDAAAFVRIGFFAVSANLVKFSFGNLQHRAFTTETQSHRKKRK